MTSCKCQTKKYQSFEIENPFYHSLPDGHIIRTLMEEHQVLLNLGNELKKCLRKIQKVKSPNEAREVLVELHFLSNHLIRSGKHHIRESQTFMNRLAEMDEFVPTQEIRRQHDLLGQQKRNLERAVYSIYINDFGKSSEAIQKVGKELVNTLADHIELEDNVLFPQAVKLITDSGWWDEMKQKCDQIGYCCFTPGK